MRASYTLTLTAVLFTTPALATMQDEPSLVDNILTKLGSSETVDESKLIDWGCYPVLSSIQNKVLALVLRQ